MTWSGNDICFNKLIYTFFLKKSGLGRGLIIEYNEDIMFFDTYFILLLHDGDDILL